MPAPGLKIRRRKNCESWYWIAPAKDVAQGYGPKSIRLNPSLTSEQREARARELWSQLEDWRAGKACGPTKYSIRWLINRYQSDEFSPYRNLSAASADGYDGFIRAIDASIGERLIVSGRKPMLCGEDFRRWHKKWGKPDEEGKATAPSRSRHMIVMMRILMSYSIEIGVPGAHETRAILQTMRFPTTEPRSTAPTRDQVLAIVTTAQQMGWPSIAATTLAQYELIERRVHIIGKWERGQWKPGWVWEDVSSDWTITYTQNKRGVVKREFNLAKVQKLLGLLQVTPKEDRVGAVIRCETTGQPWKTDYYVRVFREIARAAGVPDTVWSMDMRAGGATEADAIPGVSDRALQDAGGWLTTSMRDRYRKDKQRNAQNVVDLRQNVVEMRQKAEGE